MHHIEVSIGSTFALDGTWYNVIKSIVPRSCEGCDVVGHYCYDRPPALCSSEARSDGEDVIFVRLDDNV